MSTAAARSVTPQRVVELAARFTPEARDRIDAFLASFVSFEPQLGLLYSEREGRGGWSLVGYARPTVDSLVNIYGQFGALPCYRIDGVDVVIPQLAHVDLLDSGLLEFAGDRLVRRLPSQG